MRRALGERTAAASASSPTAARSPRAATLLATGGYAALWERTTNPPGALGEGLVLAYRAGAALADLEFVQFHPTALARRRLPALRGAARRGRAARRRRRRPLHRRARAARRRRARDRRARPRRPRPARDRARALPGPDGDARARRATTRRVEPIPVSPAAHYTVGGIVTDLDGAHARCPGSTPPASAPRTGVHGANRLASNSLLECLVFGRRAALRRAGRAAGPACRRRPPCRRVRARPSRTSSGTRSGRTRASSAAPRGSSGCARSHALLPRLVAESALARRESRGAPFPLRLPDRGRRVRRRTSSSAAAASRGSSDGADRRGSRPRRSRGARRGRRQRRP